MIFAILPGWYTEDAVAACYQALEGDGEEGTLAERVEKMAAAFAKLGVTVLMIEQKLGAPRDKWTPYDLAQLTVIYRSLQRGETTREDEFPSAAARSAAAEILQGAAARTAAPAGNAGSTEGQGEAADPPMRREPVTVPPPAASIEADAVPEPHPIGASDFGRLLASVPLGPAADVHDFLSWRVERKASSIKELSDGERASIAGYLREALEAAGGDPDEAAAAIWAQYREEYPPHLHPAWKLPEGVKPDEPGQAVLS